MSATSVTQIYGMMAEFSSPEALIHAARETRGAGFREIDAYTPYPIEALNDALDEHHSKVPLVVLTGGILGGLAGFALQVWTAVYSYPMNIGGRPNFSWPAFIVPAFECTILGASLAAVFGMLFLNGLPMPYHPVFNVARFAAASRDRYFLVIKKKDKKFDAGSTRQFLESLRPTEVSEVEY